MLFKGMRSMLGDRCRFACMLALGSMLTAGAITAQADGYEDDCERDPTCEVEGVENHYGELILGIPECPHYCSTVRNGSYCNEGAFCVWVDGLCPDSDELKVEFKVNGTEVEERTVYDRSARQKLYFEIPDFCNYEEDEYIRIKVKVKDREADTRTECEFKVKVLCGKRPHCWFNDNECAERNDDHDEMMMIYEVKTGDILPVLEICAKSRCYERARVEMFARPPFMEPISHAKSGMGQRVCIETRANDVVEGGYAEGTYWAKFRCSDVASGRSRVMKVGFRYTDPEPEVCDDLPECQVMEGSSVTVDVGSTGSLTVCGSSPCDDCDVSISEVSVPSFVMMSGGDGGCTSYTVAPMAGDEGAHTATFAVTDCNGATSQCSIEINVPMAMPIISCGEDEATSPNDTFADATVIDSGECIEDGGVTIDGVLDTPIFMNGDVDYFRFVGLTPGEVYTATIVAGMNSDNGFTDTMIGWLAAEGVIVAFDDNSGPRSVYSRIDFVADETGAATLAITGHGDDNFDGMMSNGMSYEEYGHGGYMLTIRGASVEPGEMPIERQADLNDDGVVNTADLGILIGLFGVSTN